MAYVYKIFDKVDNKTVESDDFIIHWNHQFGAGQNRWLRLFNNNYPGRYELRRIEWSNKVAVENYINSHPNGNLHFQSVSGLPTSYIVKVNDITDKDTNNELINKLVIMSKNMRSVNENGNLETSYSRNRSSIDIWRHAKFFRKDITIFEVMEELYKIVEEKKAISQFCSSVKRRVFNYVSSNGSNLWTYNYGVSSKDEYGLYWTDWKNITKDK